MNPTQARCQRSLQTDNVMATCNRSRRLVCRWSGKKGAWKRTTNEEGSDERERTGK